VIEAYFDGACEPVNPGGTAAYGVLIMQDDDVVFTNSHVVGDGDGMSNNVAEYCGFIAVLEYLKMQDLYAEEVYVYGDSKLVINQMFGDWQIKRGAYKPYALEALRLIRLFSNMSGFWIPREQNAICDELSKAALKREGIQLRIQKE